MMMRRRCSIRANEHGWYSRDRGISTYLSLLYINSFENSSHTKLSWRAAIPVCRLTPNVYPQSPPRCVCFACAQHVSWSLRRMYTYCTVLLRRTPLLCTQHRYESMPLHKKHSYTYIYVFYIKLAYMYGAKPALRRAYSLLIIFIFFLFAIWDLLLRVLHIINTMSLIMLKCVPK